MKQDELFPWEDEAEADSQGEEAGAEPAAGELTAEEKERGIDEVLEAAAAGDTALGRMVRERPIAPKEYYAISEVCELVGLRPHVLRYWETQFQLLSPSKNRSGNRVYQRKEIHLILLVKHLLYEEKYTVEGARAKLDQLRRGGELPDSTRRALDAETTSLMRAELTELLDLLKTD